MDKNISAISRKEQASFGFARNKWSSLVECNIRDFANVKKLNGGEYELLLITGVADCYRSTSERERIENWSIQGGEFNGLHNVLVGKAKYLWENWIWENKID